MNDTQMFPVSEGCEGSRGILGLDEATSPLRINDNVVWQVQSLAEYRTVLASALHEAKLDERKIVYFRFGKHEPLLQEAEATVVYDMDASEGFETFTTKTHALIEKVGNGAFTVFDSLTDLLEAWYSDLMVDNFFRVTAALLTQFKAIASFVITPITPEETSAFVSKAEGNIGKPLDYWTATLAKAHKALQSDEKTQEQTKQLLIHLLIGREAHSKKLAEDYFSLQDLLDIAAREIGTGLIGGKSIGMLLGRKILETSAADALKNHLEPHDSYYLGSDLYYTYLIQNGWWDVWLKQRKPEYALRLAPELHEKMLRGAFPASIKEQLAQMLEQFGQDPFIIRSSSLLVDNLGNSFSGKYESVFCANQGSLEKRYEALEQALRIVYASTMNKEALAYRKDRGLLGNDELMAILVQRVSGNRYGDLFFPHISGAGSSSNLYVWREGSDAHAGMLRLATGLGTRVVNRVAGDYTRLVSLDSPLSGPPVQQGDELKFSQHRADVLDLASNSLGEVPLQTIQESDLKTDKSLFFSKDTAAITRLKEEGRAHKDVPQITDFRGLFSQTDLAQFARTVLATLETEYGYPVDIEFTVNCTPEGDFCFNLLQCRPLQTKGFGAAVTIPEPNKEYLFFSSLGNFMGGNVRLPLDYVILVKTEEYLELSERDKYMIARLIGSLNQELKEHRVLLAGPGRWGTETPSLGVPTHFSEMSNMTAICEIASEQAGLFPELSFGSHFFSDMVESGIFYAAIFDGNADVTLSPERILSCDNLLDELLPEEREWEEVVHVAETAGLTLYSDITTGRVLCFG